MNYKHTLHLLAIATLVFTNKEAHSAIQAGSAYFQTINSSNGSSSGQDETYYPRVAAPDKVSVTSFFAQDCTPAAGIPPVYRLHSWMGGAMLWATGQQEIGSNGYFVGESGQVTVSGQNQTWPSPVFQQGPVIADPIILTYSSPPNASNSNPLTRGIQLTLPYPYLAPDTAYGPTCQASSSTWQTTPLALFTDPIPMILIYPATSAPVDGVAAGDSVWEPNAIIVDKMGDYSVDLIYQNPQDPYQRSDDESPTNGGSYIKCTIVQGSPYVFIECLGVEYVAVSNQITASSAASGLIQPATNPASIPTLDSQFKYSLLGGNQIDPGQFAENQTLNPMVNPAVVEQGQDNYTTWALYFNSNEATFTPGSSTQDPQNSYFTITDTAKKFYFIMAALPTIYQYPHQGAPFDTYSSATTQSGYNIVNYAESLGLYAFNFVTNTTIDYTVTGHTFVETTFSPTLTQRYSSDHSAQDSTKTVMCLMPHQYQSQVFDTVTSLNPVVLPTSSNWSAFSPTSTSNLFYWTVRGNLYTIAGSSFMTKYVFSNFLPTMPTPYWTDPVPLGTNSSPYATTTIGQLLFDSLDNEFVSNLSNPAYTPWNTAYATLDKGIYDVGKTLSKGAKQLGLLLHYIQGAEQNSSNPSSSFYNFFGNGSKPSTSSCLSSCSSYTTAYTSLYEQQYNNDFGAQPSRPGAFNPCSGIVPSKSITRALRDSLQVSVLGSPNPILSGMQGAFNGYFGAVPTISSGGYGLAHFAYYDTVAHLVMLYPSAGDPSNGTPWPGRKQTIPLHAGPGNVWESFGVANAFNDHHYQYGWWLSGTGLTALYDGSWSQTPTASSWAASSNYGAAIDQIVKDIAYDPALASSFYSDNSNLMYFAKMNFFDQWAGHGWADGIQATIAGGNAGHNENSIGEALQAYASIILWGVATQRADIVDLGIYLYTTTSYAMDSYFFDKNLNYKTGGSSFVPTITTTSPPAGYSFGTGFWDYTIHSTNTSGTPKMAQAVLNYSADFGQTPENVKAINAFPVTSFSLVFGRNTSYLHDWNAAMDTCAFNNTQTTLDSSCWTTNFVANFNMLRALGGNTTSIGIPQSSCPPSTSPLSPYQAMLQLLTSDTSNGCPPWGSTGGAYIDPGQSINEVLHFLHTIDHYGTIDWNYYGQNSSNPSGLVFTATFTKGDVTTGFAFNPTLSPITVQFYKVEDSSSVGSSFTVNPKRWANIQLPSL